MMLWEVVEEALEVLRAAQQVVPGDYVTPMPLPMPMRQTNDDIMANGNGNGGRHCVDDDAAMNAIDAMLGAMSDEDLCAMLRDDSVMVRKALESADILEALKVRVDEVDNASMDLAKRSLEVEQRAAELRNVQKVIKSGNYSKVQIRYGIRSIRGW